MNFLYSLLFLAVSLAPPNSTQPSVTASLSRDSAEINQPVQLRLSIRPGQITSPPKIAAAGLAITFDGQSVGIQTVDGQTMTSTTFHYTVVAEHEGTFVIPSVTIEVGNKKFRTEKLTLKVGRPTTDNGGAGAKPYFAELIVPKDSAYVGEPIPIELRFYFDRRIWYEPYPQGQLPIIEGGDFVTKKYPSPTEKQQVVNGREYQVLVYKTAITGVKSGRLDLQAAYQEFMIRAPMIRRSLPGTDDFYDQSPGSDPFDSFERKDVKIEAPGRSLDIKPLPEAGKPASFSGAIGRFTLKADAQPARARVGDPITIRAAIEGLGSFDRMEPPILTDAVGWKTYQPSSDFVANDELGISGVRTFTYAAVPSAAVSRTPVVEFSYFDPDAEKYVTLRSPTMLVQVEGRSLPDQGAQTNSIEISPAAPAPSSTPPLEVLDIQTANSPLVSFEPLVRRPYFWLIQTLPAAVLILIGAGFWLRTFQLARAPLQSLRAERSALRGKLDQSDARIVLPAAVRLLLLDCQIKAGGTKPVASIEQELRGRPVPEELRQELESLLARNDRVVYGHLDQEPLSESERTKLKQIIRQWEHTS